MNGKPVPQGGIMQSLAQWFPAKSQSRLATALPGRNDGVAGGLASPGVVGGMAGSNSGIGTAPANAMGTVAGRLGADPSRMALGALGGGALRGAIGGLFGR